MIANPASEQISRDELSAVQLKRLKKQVKWALEKSAFYYQKFSEAGIAADTIQGLDDIARLPFTTDEELQEASPYDLLTLPVNGIIRMSRIGTDQHFLKMYTGGDLAYQIEMMTRTLVAQNINSATVVGIFSENGDSRFLDVQYALENMGVTVLLLGNRIEDIKYMFNACHMDVIISDYRQLMQLIAVLQDSGLTPEIFDMPRILCMEEGLWNPNNAYLEQQFSTKITSICNMPALGCGGMLLPCGDALHVQEDYFYPEILEYGTDRLIMENNKVGELVLTSLMAEAMPIFRYRTGIAVMRLGDEVCSCGRTQLKVASPIAYAGMVWQAVKK